MKLTNILLMIVIVVISVVGYFAVTEERLCETESTDSNYMEGHAGHQLNNLLADAVDLVEDIFTAEYLKEILFDNLDDSLVYWAEFEQALNEASDNPDIEEQLIAMDNEIKDIALERLFKRIKITLK